MSAPLLRVWSAALALATAVLAAPSAAPDEWLLFGHDPPDAPILIVGTSLMGYGIPSRSRDENGLLGDGRRHVRLAKGSMREDEVIRFASIALDRSPVETLLLEIYPFARSLAYDRADQQAARVPFAHSISSAALGASRTIADDLRKLIDFAFGGRDGVNEFMYEPNIDRREEITPDVLSRAYPIELHEPRLASDLAILLASAQERGIDVYFIAPPISEASAAYQGQGTIRALGRHVHVVADRLSVPLLFEGAVWPDRFFVDHAHLNRDGRERLIAELRARWAARRDG